MSPSASSSSEAIPQYVSDHEKWIHDIGHVLTDEYIKQNNIQRDELGTINHEIEGAKFLRSLGLNERVCRLVELHVTAKRYLMSTDNNYKNLVSDASLKVFKQQGGILSNEEILVFEKDPLFTDSITLCRIDEDSKTHKIISEQDSITSFMKFIMIIVSSFEKKISNERFIELYKTYTGNRG